MLIDRNEEPREYGVGVVGDLLQIEQNSEVRPRFVRQQMDQLEDYRPYFSYWITTVQIIIMIITLCRYRYVGLSRFFFIQYQINDVVSTYLRMYIHILKAYFGKVCVLRN